MTRILWGGQPNRRSTWWQYEVYYQLRLAGVRVHPEVSFPSPFHKSGKFTADLVICDAQDRAIGLIEVKNELEVIGEKQRAAYESTGLPWRVTDFTEGPTPCIEWARELRGSE